MCACACACMSAAVESSRVLKLVALHTRLVSAMMPPPMIYLPDTVVCGYLHVAQRYCARAGEFEVGRLRHQSKTEDGQVECDMYLLFHIRGEDEGQITCVHKGKFSEFDESIRTDPHGFFRLRYSVSSRTHHIAEFGFSYQGSDCPFDSLKHIQNELTFPHPPQFCGYYLGTPYCLLMRIPLLEQDPLWITRQMTLPMAPRHMHADLPALRRLGILLSQLDSH